MNKIKFENYPNFKPDYSPVEMATLGVFGGSYFSRHHYSESYDYNQIKKLVLNINKSTNKDFNQMLSKRIYEEKLNYFKVKCGSSLEDWQNRGWLFEEDKYGWYEWFIKFYYGRRIPKIDNIQIKRWLSFKSRHGGMLKTHCKPSEIKKSLKTRQNLLHWAIDSTKI